MTSSHHKFPKISHHIGSLRAATYGELGTEYLGKSLKLTHIEFNFSCIVFLIDYDNTLNQNLTCSLILTSIEMKLCGLELTKMASYLGRKFQVLDATVAPMQT